MQNVRAIVREGKIVPLESLDLPEGTEVVITPVHEDSEFWVKASETSLGSIWDNEEDDVYAELLEN